MPFSGSLGRPAEYVYQLCSSYDHDPLTFMLDLDITYLKMYLVSNTATVAQTVTHTQARATRRVRLKIEIHSRICAMLDIELHDNETKSTA